MVVKGEPTDGDPPPTMGVSSWEDAITGMIDDEFNADAGVAYDAILDVFGGGPPAMAVPENIIQPAPTEDSSPLIFLESLESGGHSLESGGHSASAHERNIPQDNSSCLDDLSSCSSKGSQGSYADQVPALSQSGSTAAQAVEEAKRSELGSPWTLPGDDNSSSTNGDKGVESESSKDAPLVVMEPPPVAADVDFFAELTPVPEPTSEAEAIKDSSETAEIKEPFEPVVKEEPPQEAEKAREEPQQETERATEDYTKKVQAVEEEKTETPKPGMANTNLTIKTSFSSELPTGKDSLHDTLHDSNDSDDSKGGTSITSNVSAMVQQFTEAEVKPKESEDLDDILGENGRPAGPTPPNQPEGTMSSPTSDMAGIYSLRSERSESSLRTNRTEPSNRSERSEPLAAVSEAASEDSEAKRTADPLLLAATQKELEALTSLTSLTSIKETAPTPSQAPEPSLAELQSKKSEPNTGSTVNPLDRIVASLEKYDAQQTRPNQGPVIGTPHTRAFIGLANSDQSTTFDSPGSFQTSASGSPVSAVSRESDQGGTSFWSNSAGESESNVGTFIGDTFSRTGTTVASPTGTWMATSPAGTSVGSPTGTSVAGTETSHPTYASEGSEGSETEVSLVDTLSPGGTSTSASVTQHTLSIAGTDTFHTRSTYQSHILSMQETPMSRGESLSDRESISQSTTDKTETEGTRTDGSGIHSATSAESDVSEETRGGRLWELANKEAEKHSTMPLSPESSRFAESLMARTRSRADPDALVNGSASVDRGELISNNCGKQTCRGCDAHMTFTPIDSDRPTMVKIGEQDEEKFIVHTALARKRVRVVQLLIVGLVALLVSFLGNLWIQSSCHFVSASVEVGERGQVFDLHYGLWKYSPIDSAFQGYAYCFQYDDEYTTDAPMFSRWFSVLALFGGSFSLAVLWIYLILGRGNTFTWNLAVYLAGMSGCLQVATLIILAGPVCQRDECSLGPAGILSIVASVVYFILAFEMHYNTPMTAWVTELELATCPSNEQPGNLMANLEMTDFKHGAKAYVSRIVAGDEPYKSLNQIQRGNRNPIGEGMLERDLSNTAMSYKPPALIV
jgi:hypothetical protein